MPFLTHPLVTAIAGAVVASVLTYGGNYWQYQHVYKPQLKLARDQAQAYKQDAAEKAKQRDESASKLATYEAELNKARSQFSAAIMTDMNCALENKAAPSTGEGPPKSPRPCAMQLIDDRDAARSAALGAAEKVRVSMDGVFRALDHSIDELADLLRRQPPTKDQEISDKIAEIYRTWAERMNQLSTQSDLALRAVGCPTVLTAEK